MSDNNKINLAKNNGHIKPNDIKIYKMHLVSIQMELDKIRIRSEVFSQEKWTSFERYGEFWSKRVYSLAMQEALLTEVNGKNLGAFLYDKGGYFDSHPEIRAVVYHFDKWFAFKDDSFKNKLEQIAAISNLLPICFLPPIETESKHNVFNELFGIGSIEAPQLISPQQA